MLPLSFKEQVSQTITEHEYQPTFIEHRYSPLLFFASILQLLLKKCLLYMFQSMIFLVDTYHPLLLNACPCTFLNFHLYHLFPLLSEIAESKVAITSNLHGNIFEHSQTPKNLLCLFVSVSHVKVHCLLWLI